MRPREPFRDPPVARHPEKRDKTVIHKGDLGVLSRRGLRIAACVPGAHSRDDQYHRWTVEAMTRNPAHETAAPSDRRELLLEVLVINAIAWATLPTVWLTASLLGEAPSWVKVLAACAVLLMVMGYAWVTVFGGFEHVVLGLPFVAAVLIGGFRPALWPVMLVVAVLPALAMFVFMAVSTTGPARSKS